MPQIELSQSEIGEGQLPPVCMRCGDAALTYRKATFAWSPWWIICLMMAQPFSLPALIALLPWAPRHRVVVWAPFCALHRNHWRWRNVVLVSWVGVIAGLGTAGVIALNTAGDSNPPAWGITSLGLFGLLYFAFFPAILILKYTGIHEGRITKETIVLKDVAPEFLEARRVHCATSPQN